MISLLLAIGNIGAAKEEVTFRQWAWSNMLDAFRAFNEIFEADHPEIKFNFETIDLDPFSMPQKLAILSAAGSDGPDIVVLHGGIADGLIETGYVESLPAEVMKYQKDFAPSVWQSTLYKDKIYAIQWDASPSGLFYRKDLFEELGIEPPASWDQYIQVGKKVTQDLDGDGKTDRWMTLQDPIYALTWLQGWGVQVFDRYNNDAVLLDTPEVIEAIRFWTDMATKEGVINFKKRDTAYWTQVQEGQVLTLWFPQWFTADLAGKMGLGGGDSATHQGKWRVAGQPTISGGPGGADTGGSYVGISAVAENKELAWEYIEKFWLTVDGRYSAPPTASFPPTFIPAMLDARYLQPVPYFGDQIVNRVFMEAMPYVHPGWRKGQFYSTAQGLAGEAVSAIVQGMSVEEALQEAADKLRVEMSR